MVVGGRGGGWGGRIDVPFKEEEADFASMLTSRNIALRMYSANMYQCVLFG